MRRSRQRTGPQSGADPLRTALFAALTHLKELSEIANRAVDEDSYPSVFDDLIHPPSAWAHCLADRAARGTDRDLIVHIKQLIAAVNDLPDQIATAREDRREQLAAAFGTTQSAP
jgi:hypothetical protein